VGDNPCTILTVFVTDLILFKRNKGRRTHVSKKRIVADLRLMEMLFKVAVCVSCATANEVEIWI
jgi:hypothetical protein